MTNNQPDDRENIKKEFRKMNTEGVVVCGERVNMDFVKTLGTLLRIWESVSVFLYLAGHWYNLVNQIWLNVRSLCLF